MIFSGRICNGKKQNDFRSGTLMGEVMAAFTGILLLMCIVIRVPNFFRKLVWNHSFYPVLAAILHGLLVVPAFEFQHIQHLVHVSNLRFNSFLLLFKKFLSLGICGCTFYAPIHETFDVLDLQPGFFQTLNDSQSFDFRITEFADAGYSLHSRKKALFIIISQCGDGQSEHLRYLSDCIHKKPPKYLKST